MGHEAAFSKSRPLQYEAKFKGTMFQMIARRITKTGPLLETMLAMLALEMLFPLSVRQVDAADIELRPLATVSSSSILVRDVAIVGGADAAMATRIENLVLAPTPAPGRRVRLEYSAIQSRLEAAGISSADVSFSGSSAVIVASTQQAPVKPRAKSRAKAVVSQAQIRRAEKTMTDAVRQSLRLKNRESQALFVDVTVEPSDVPAILGGAAEGFEIGAIKLASAETQAIEVRAHDDQGHPVAFRIDCVVSERPEVPVVNHSISTGDVIHEADLAMKQVDTVEGLVTRVEEIIEKEAKRTIHVDEPIHADDIRTVPLVRSGDIVTGVWKSGGIRITGQFKAKGDGGKGDVITLVKLTGRDQVLARVTDIHEAEIVSADPVTPNKGDPTAANNAGSKPMKRRLVRRSPVIHAVTPAKSASAPASDTELVGGESQ